MPGLNCLSCPQGISRNHRESLNTYHQIRSRHFPHFVYHYPKAGSEVLCQLEEHGYYRLYTLFSLGSTKR